MPDHDYMIIKKHANKISYKCTVKLNRLHNDDNVITMCAVVN